jgi:HlyD family secretion protein
VVAGSRREDVQLARAQLTAAEARRDQARAALDRLTVRAPIAGEVLQVKYRAGEYYQPGAEPLLVLGDTRALRVRMDVDERDVARVALGDAATLRVSACPAATSPARSSSWAAAWAARTCAPTIPPSATTPRSSRW